MKGDSDIQEQKARRVAEALGIVNPNIDKWGFWDECFANYLTIDVVDRVALLLDERDALMMETQPVGTTRPTSTNFNGCSSHACLIKKPGVGTNSGKCFCHQSVVRQYIDTLRADLAAVNESLRARQAELREYADIICPDGSSNHEERMAALKELAAAKAEVERLRDALDDGWRPASEPPEDDRIVHILIGKAIVNGQYLPDGTWWEVDFGYNASPSHWRELPALPKQNPCEKP